MALSLSSTTTCSTAYCLPQQQPHHSSVTRLLRFRVSCKAVQIETEQQQQQPQRIKKRKPRPSFLQQIQEKWSVKVGSPRDKLPWQKLSDEENDDDDEEEQEEENESEVYSEAEVSGPGPVNQQVGFSLPNREAFAAPWAHGSKPSKTQVDSKAETRHPRGEKLNGFGRGSEVDNSTGGGVKVKKFERKNDGEGKLGRGNDRFSAEVKKEKETVVRFEQEFDRNGKLGRETGEISAGVLKKEEKVVSESLELEVDRNGRLDRVSGGGSVGVLKEEETVITKGLNEVSLEETLPKDTEIEGHVETSVSAGSVSRASARLPWERESKMVRRKWSNTHKAEVLIPEHELKRLRNVSLRMLERTKVGAAGITQVLVDAIHEKWKVDEVVKLKFQEPLSLNMRRTHGILESKTGGLVIWRSGSSVVLYRSISYNLPCVQSFNNQSQTSSRKLQDSDNVISDGMQNVGVKDVAKTTELLIPNSPKYLKDLSQKELMELSDLNHLLDELGPRFKDWIGREPVPVDADLLPPVVRGYKTPFRLLPYGVRQTLRDKDTTKFRRLARAAPPHFALGRSRELQGLAKAMVKLWEKCAIAKIAIKRGVPNTNNDRMAEELKRLTGGTLLSRNKEFIVFYRGNDFLPPAVTGVLKERRELRDLQQDEEEQARQMASDIVASRSKASDGQLVAGTLAETMAATTRWRNQRTIEDLDKMTRDSALARRASLVRHLEKKLALAKGKFRKAEKALAKVQEKLKPADLPDDLETLTDEDRFLFRKMGLSMKPFLLLGKRGVYSGTIENMHLHWKYRELVKIIVRGKSFQQIKHIAISLEAESGGLLVSLDKTTKGYAIIFYRGKNYQCPLPLRPRNLLTRRQALARSIELQRREALKHHLSDLQERIELVKAELEEMENGRVVDDGRTLQSVSDASLLPNDNVEDEGEEAYLEVYDSETEDKCDKHETDGPV